MSGDRDGMSDRELLIRIDERLETAVGRINDHGARLRALERWRWIAVGGIGAIGAFLKFRFHIGDGSQ